MLTSPKKPAPTEDAFAEFAPEPVGHSKAIADHDWLSEFPEESAVKKTQKAPPALNWSALGRSLRNEER